MAPSVTPISDVRITTLKPTRSETRAPDAARQDVPTEVIESEQMLLRRRLQPANRVLMIRIERRQERRRERNEDQRQRQQRTRREREVAK